MPALHRSLIQALPVFSSLVVVGRQKVIVCDLERLSRIADETGPER
jgi:hypothetical protein